MIKQLLTSAVFTAAVLNLAACSGEGTVGVTYSNDEPAYLYNGPDYVAPGPPVGFYEGNIYFDNFDTYWHHHHDWDHDHAWHEWQRHPREHRHDEWHEGHHRHEH